MGIASIPPQGNPTGWIPPSGWVAPFGITAGWFPGMPQLPLQFPILPIANAQTASIFNPGIQNQIMQQNLAANSSIISKGPVLNPVSCFEALSTFLKVLLIKISCRLPPICNKLRHLLVLNHVS
jgi:hypothetical protein